jgi:heptosyltransferase I
MEGTLDSRLLHIDAQRICVIKPSALGDIVQSLPLLGALRQRFPSARISWVVNRELSDLLTGHPELHEVIPFDRRGPLSSVGQLLWDLRQRRFDLAFDLQGLLRTGLMTLATGARLRIGLETAREGSALACHELIPGTSRQVPAHQRYWRVAETLKVGDLPRLARVPTTAADRSWVLDRLWGLPRPLVAVHPGAKWVTKRWPPEKFAELAVRFARRYAGTVITVGGNGDWPAATTITAAVGESGGRAVNLAGTTTLRQLAALLGAVDLVVSNDSGPMHLAAAMGTPVVGIFTCTSPVISGPAGPGHRVVATHLPCAAGYHKTCPHRGPDHLACFRELDVERAWSAFAAALDGLPQPLQVA